MLQPPPQPGLIDKSKCNLNSKLIKYSKISSLYVNINNHENTIKFSKTFPHIKVNDFNLKQIV